MRVMLINPSFARYGGLHGHGGSMIPINLCYLAGYARQKHPNVEFKIFDSEIYNYNHDETVDEIGKFLPDLIGISANTGVFDSVIALIAKIKKRFPKVKTVIGGPHPSAIPDRALTESEADFVAVGEGEKTLSELISQMKKKSNDWSRINGLVYYSESGTIKGNSRRELIKDLDQIPFPARDLLDNNLYSPAPTKRLALGPNTLLTTSRGCPFNCGFCGAHTVWTRKVRYRTPINVIKEIEDCISRYGIQSFNLTDELFTVNKDRVMEICRLICNRKIKTKWVCFARAQNLDREILEAMKEAGCGEISFGIESGNQNVLKRIDKSLTLSEAQNVIRLTKKIGIKTHASYIMGYLGETEETMADTIRFAKKLNTEIAAFFIASPLPGTKFYNEALKKGYLESDSSWVNYSPLSNKKSVFSMPKLSSETIRKFHRKALKSYYLRPRYIISRLLSLRHWYDLKNVYEEIKLFFRIKK